MFTAFWSKFLVKFSNICDSAFDCFSIGLGQVENCRTIDTLNVTLAVQCYRIQLDLINAAAKAGGIQGLITTLMYGSVTLSMWVKKKNKFRAPTVCTKRMLRRLVDFITSLLVLIEVVAISAIFYGINGTLLSQTLIDYTDYVLSILFTSTSTIAIILPQRFLLENDTSNLDFDHAPTSQGIIEYSTIDWNKSLENKQKVTMEYKGIRARFRKYSV